jgi:hypothetical protein
MRSNCTGQREKRVDHKRDEVYIGVLYALSHGVEKGCEDPRGRLHHGMTGSSLRHGLAGPLRSGLRDCFVHGSKMPLPGGVMVTHEVLVLIFQVRVLAG